MSVSGGSQEDAGPGGKSVGGKSAEDSSPYFPSAEFLPPDEVSVARTPGGQIVLTTADGETTDVRIVQVFPLNPTDRMVAFLSTDDRCLGTLKDYREIEGRSARVVEEELSQQYFQPAILKIRSLKKRFGLIEMEIDTEAGSRLVRFRSARDDIRELGPGRYLLTDATGNRYELPCLDAVDDSTRSLWHNLV
ncbi:MAG: DUF1854 domain-containing protein [Chloroflexi bacterium]|nr:DUF1854 domain-containing protein [Chloroflexota bacterium]